VTRFRFTAIRHPAFGTIRYPLIPVRLLGPAGSLRKAMVLDSGADITMLPAWVAEYLGIALAAEPVREVRGISGSSLPYVTGEIDLEIGTRRFRVRVAWALVESAPSILGRLDLFDQTDILFQQSANAITLLPPASPPASLP
jgi:hypothetical protein